MSGAILFWISPGGTAGSTKVRGMTVEPWS